MKKSPFIRIREKNQEIKELNHQLNEIASLLACQPTLEDILPSIVEALEWKSSYMAAMTENDGLRVKMGEMIKEQVDKLTFKVQLENQKLQHEVDRLTKIVDTKGNEIQSIRQKTQGNQKGFWDFLYKVFKVA